jgi:uncharacterized peroxidase-related enzyme
MPRLPVIDPASATGKVKDIFDGPLKGKHLNIFKGLANSPAALQAYLGMSGALNEGVLTPAEREVIALTVGEANNCGYCVAAHTALGKKAGLSEPQTVEARRGKMADAKLGALSRFVGLLGEKKGFVSDGDLAAFKQAGYTDAHVAESIACYALNLFTNYFNHVNDTKIDVPAPPKLD